MNDTIYKLIKMIEKNGDSVITDFKIVIDENGKYRYSFCEDLAFDKPCFSDINEIDTTDKLMLSECIEGEKCF